MLPGLWRAVRRGLQANFHLADVLLPAADLLHQNLQPQALLQPAGLVDIPIASSRHANGAGIAEVEAGKCLALDVSAALGVCTRGARPGAPNPDLYAQRKVRIGLDDRDCRMRYLHPHRPPESVRMELVGLILQGDLQFTSLNVVAAKFLDQDLQFVSRVGPSCSKVLLALRPWGEALIAVGRVVEPLRRLPQHVAVAPYAQMLKAPRVQSRLRQLYP